MNNIALLLCMIFCHIVDDYYMQGLLASLKQKEWWKKNAPDNMYKRDWVIALIMHATSWAFMMMLPIMLVYKFNPPIWFIVVFLINVVIHAIVDDLKANKRKINLIVDQTTHILQICATFFIYMLLK